MNPEIVLTTIQLLLARPEAADLRKQRHYAAEIGADVEEVSYIVKLYLKNTPPYDNMGFEFYVGDQRIRKYSQFKNGIYFKINDPRRLSALRGKEVRFRRPGSEEFTSTGINFPEAVTERRLEDAEATQRPTQKEVLRE